MIRRPPRSTLSSSSAASDVYKRQAIMAAGFRTHEPTGPDPSTKVLLSLFMQRILKLPLRRFEKKAVVNDGERQVELVYSNKNVEGEEEELEDEDDLEAAKPKLKKFSHDEFTLLAKHFKAMGSEGGVPTTQFVEALTSLVKCNSQFAVQLGNVCDLDNHGSVAFQDFQSAMLVLAQGQSSAEERIRYMFGAYDVTNSGTIAKSEVVLFVTMAHRLSRPEENQPRESLKAHVEQMFKEHGLFIQGDSVTLEECLGAMTAEHSGYFAQLFDAL
eukprot:TRINITY_DN12894_c0_g3_i1.p1 TRINITY_DN12894_c0_g3~~TRINITY_DN12894_c0_g3_i1.p1  ORF type:complete len:272 (-),score=89.34 TRINITY_DN12894_c0_g3_i1:458-1273(-)